MPSPLVECIPNFSEARRPEVVEAIIQAIQSVDGVTVLDRHSDLDHNRTVITFVGSPQVVEDAAFRAIAKAAQLIDLNHHHGEHPRIGATDVVPFVPISGAAMADCVDIARRLGKRVGSELDIPVYLYEEAATRPDRQNLENIRHGQYEGLKQEIGTDPNREPDFGPARVGSAGATVIGARPPLIAYNVYLTTDDVMIAQKIARAIRNSSGGLHFVKALGLLVEGRAQVSMNLTNYHQTPIARVVEMIRREASRYGVGIHHSELVGLIPQDALTDAAVWYLQLDGFEPAQILEKRLYDALSEKRGAEQPLPQTFLDELAAGTPTPGGGAAAAHTAAAAAALVAMVARLTAGKKKYAAVEPRMWEVVERAENLRSEMTEAVQRDMDAFGEVMAALRLPKDTPQEQEMRRMILENSMLGAAVVPLEVARGSVAIMELAVETAETGNSTAISDAASGLALARAALTSAGLNVRVNTKSIQNQDKASPLLAELEELERRAGGIEDRLRQALSERAGIQFD